MEHKRIEYAVRARPGLNEWMWAIYPNGVPPKQGEFTGSRRDALEAARGAIDRWLDRNQAKRRS